MSATIVALNPENDNIDFSGSLNAGSELDDEVPVLQVDEFVPEDYSSIEEEQKQLVALENKAIDLLDLVATIKSTNGMTKRFALEAETILPSFPKLAQGFYTSIPTATRLQVSLEEMSKGLMALIAAAVTMVIAAIVKFISWVTGKKSDTADKSESEIVSDIETASKEKEAAVNVFKECTDKLVDLDKEAAKDVYRAIVVIDNGDDVAPTHIESLQQAIEIFFIKNEKSGHLKKFINAEDVILRDILNNGEYSKKILSVQKQIGSISTSLKQKSNLLSEILKEYVKGNLSVESVGMLNRKLEIINKKLTLSAFGKVMTVQEISDTLTSARIQTEINEDYSPVTFDRVIKGVSDFYSRLDYVHYNKSVTEASKAMASMKTSMGRLSAIPGGMYTDGDNTSALAASIRQAIFTIGSEVSATRHLLSNLDSYFLRASYFSKEIAGVATHIYETLDKNTAIKTEHYPDLWENYVKKASALRNQLQKAYAAFDKAKNK